MFQSLGTKVSIFKWLFMASLYCTDTHGFHTEKAESMGGDVGRGSSEGRQRHVRTHFSAALTPILLRHPSCDFLVDPKNACLFHFRNQLHNMLVYFLFIYYVLLQQSILETW